MHAEQVRVVDLIVGKVRRDWCGRCLTSAVLVIGVHHIAADGVSPVGTVRACTRCDPHLFEAES